MDRVKELLFSFAGGLPDRAWGPGAGERCLLPYYHVVSDEWVPHVSPLYRFRSVREFQQDLEYFARRRRPIGLAEFVAAVQSTGQPPAGSVLFTFDDGFRETHDIVRPLLAKQGIPAVFFLTSATIDNRHLCHHQKIAVLLDTRAKARSPAADREAARLLAQAGLPGADVDAELRALPYARGALVDALGALHGVDFAAYARTQQPYLTTGQVRTMLADGLEIGAHSIDHPRYADLPLEEQLRHTRESMEALVRQFGLRHRAFAFPHTDRGVRSTFFDRVAQEKLVDVSFGTAAPMRDSIPFNFQRFTMEKSRLSASAIVARSRLRRLRFAATGTGAMDRR